MKTRREFIIEQAAALQVAAVNNPRHEDRGGDAVASLCVKDAERLANALELTDGPEAGDCYTVPREMGDAFVEWTSSAQWSGVIRDMRDHLKAQQKGGE